MEKPNIYLDAVGVEEYQNQVDNNNLPFVIVTNEASISKLDPKYKKQLDIQYTKNSDGTMYYLRVIFVDKAGEAQDWGKIITPNGKEDQINEFQEYKHKNKKAIAISTDDNYYKCVDVLENLKEKVSVLKQEINMKRTS